MTTIVGLCTSDYVILTADSQITTGNLKLPLSYKKIQIPAYGLMIAASGSVGVCQNLSKVALRLVKHAKIDADQDITPISPDEFAKVLSELNFSLPLKFDHFSSSDFLIAGSSNGTPKLFCVGLDGSTIESNTFYSIGSGSQLAISLLSTNYNPKDDFKVAAGKLLKIMNEVCKSDIYTNAKVDCFICHKNGKTQVLEPVEEVKT